MPPEADAMGLTLAQLTQAIRRKVDIDMETIVAESIAEHALGFFGFSNRIIDNALEPTDRNLFYQLQDYDLLTTESEETTLWDGREWRIHYWKFKANAEELARLSEEDVDSGEDEDPYAGIYEDVPVSLCANAPARKTTTKSHCSEQQDGNWFIFSGSRHVPCLA